MKKKADPVVFFKILLIGYLNNINSDRIFIAEEWPKRINMFSWQSYAIT